MEMGYYEKKEFSLKYQKREKQYLETIYLQIIRNSKTEKFSKNILYEYLRICDFISSKIFTNLTKKTENILNLENFVTGITLLFSKFSMNNNSQLPEFIFNLLSYDKEFTSYEKIITFFNHLLFELINNLHFPDLEYYKKFEFQIKIFLKKIFKIKRKENVKMEISYIEYLNIINLNPNFINLLIFLFDFISPLNEKFIFELIEYDHYVFPNDDFEIEYEIGQEDTPRINKINYNDNSTKTNLKNLVDIKQKKFSSKHNINEYPTEKHHKIYNIENNISTNASSMDKYKQSFSSGLSNEKNLSNNKKNKISCFYKTNISKELISQNKTDYLLQRDKSLIENLNKETELYNLLLKLNKKFEDSRLPFEINNIRFNVILLSNHDLKNEKILEQNNLNFFNLKIVGKHLLFIKCKSFVNQTQLDINNNIEGLFFFKINNIFFEDLDFNFVKNQVVDFKIKNKIVVFFFIKFYHFEKGYFLLFHSLDEIKKFYRYIENTNEYFSYNQDRMLMNSIFKKIINKEMTPGQRFYISMMYKFKHPETQQNMNIQIFRKNKLGEEHLNFFHKIFDMCKINNYLNYHIFPLKIISETKDYFYFEHCINDFEITFSKNEDKFILTLDDVYIEKKLTKEILNFKHIIKSLNEKETLSNLFELIELQRGI